MEVTVNENIKEEIGKFGKLYKRLKTTFFGKKEVPKHIIAGSESNLGNNKPKQNQT